MQTLEQPFLEACNKLRGKYIWKEVFMRPFFVRLSFVMRLLSLRRYVSSIYMYVTVYLRANAPLKS